MRMLLLAPFVAYVVNLTLNSLEKRVKIRQYRKFARYLGERDIDGLTKLEAFKRRGAPLDLTL